MKQRIIYKLNRLGYKEIEDNVWENPFLRVEFFENKKYRITMLNMSYDTRNEDFNAFQVYNNIIVREFNKLNQFLERYL